MKNNFIFLFISILNFITVNSEDLSPIKITPLFIGSIPSSTFPIFPNSTQLETNLPDTLVLGFKKLSTEINIRFYVFTRVIGRYPSKLSLTAQVASTRNLRFLEDIDFDCSLADTNNNGINNKYTFDCSHAYDKAKDIIIDLDTIRIDGEKPESTPGAIYSKDLNNDISDLLDNKELLVMRNSAITNTNNKIEIQGTIDETIYPNNPYLLVIDGESKENCTCNYNNLGNRIYTLTLNPKSSFEGNLHEQMGRINDDQSVILDFSDGTGNVNYSPIDVYRSRKSSSSLSTGAIIAIIIPCVAVLLAIVGLTFMMGKKGKNLNHAMGNVNSENNNSAVKINIQ